MRPMAQSLGQAQIYIYLVGGCPHGVMVVEKGKISYFGLAHNLIRHLISPNQDDLSYSTRTFHFKLTDGLSCVNTLSLAGERQPVQTSHWPFFNSDAF